LQSNIKNQTSLIIFIVSTIFFAYLAVLDPSYIDQRIESLSLIYRFQIRNLISKPKVPENIIIVFIDEKSLKEFGRWPWNRSLQAKLINKVLEENPKVLAIDILYSEAENKKNDGEMAKVLEPYKDKVVVAQDFEVPVEQAKYEKDDKKGPEPPDYFLDNVLNVKDPKLGRPAAAINVIPAIPDIGQNTNLGDRKSVV
jgi:CHASE2 domain-containing sensor protein